MDLTIVAGNSIKNKEWINEVTQAMSAEFSVTLPHFYKHWETGEKLMNFEKEVRFFSQNLTSNNNFSIFAKSAGIMVALKAVYSNNIKPKKCIFVGTPIYWAQDNNIEFDDWLKNFPIPTLFIQHTNDPTIAAKDLKQLLETSNVKQFSFTELSGESHDYPEVETLVSLTAEFVGKI